MIREIIFIFIQMAPYILLGLAAAGLLSVFITKELVARFLGENKLSSAVKASIFGIPLPLCSCGVIPSAVFLKNNNASKPAVISFLISTPQTGIDSIIASYGLMGPFFAVLRPLSAFFTGVLGGFLSYIFDRKSSIDSSTAENDAADSIAVPDSTITSCSDSCEKVLSAGKNSIREKIRKFSHFTFKGFLDDISLPLVAGIIAAGAVTWLIPDNFFEETVISGGLSGMLFMLVLGMPLYVCSTSSIPIAIAMIAKGISPGAAYVFLIAGPAVNAASFPVLLRVLGKKQTFIYISSIVTGSIASGFFIDFIASRTDITSSIVMSGLSGGSENIEKISVLSVVFSIFFLVLLIVSLGRKAGLGRVFSIGKTKGIKPVSCCN